MMNTENIQKTLINSEVFDNALTSGSKIKDEIDVAIKTRNKNNYNIFFDILLHSRTDIQSILDKKKKNRTDEENDIYKKFVKETKTKYKLVKDMLFISEDDKLNADGTENTISKKLAKLVDTLSSVHALLKYIGCNTLDEELQKRGIRVISKSMEEQSEVFENELVKKDVNGVFEQTCLIQSDIEEAKRKITEDIFSSMVPSELQYDKNTNPTGLKGSDFDKLVSIKHSIIKAEKSDNDEKEKVNDKVTVEAEKKTFDIARNETILEFLSSAVCPDR